VETGPRIDGAMIGATATVRPASQR
jgi:hypothetical protein